MLRFILALVAVLVLALSAGLSRNSFPSAAPAPAASAFGSLSARQALAAELDLGLANQPRSAPARGAAGEEAPSPALLAYLMLVLIGSAVAVGAVYRGQRREF